MTDRHGNPERMSRLERFSENAGGNHGFRIFILLIVLFFALKEELETGRFALSFSALALGFAIPFVVRETIIRHFSVAAVALNTVAFGGIVLAVFWAKESDSVPWWLPVSFEFVIPFYLSAYFWMLSDARTKKT